jgi:hypothetical protein
MWLLIKLSLSLALSLIVANNGAPMLLWHVDRNADMVGWTFIKDRASYREKVVATSRDKKEVSASRVILPDAIDKSSASFRHSLHLPFALVRAMEGWREEGREA